MTPGARVQAAIEILDAIALQRAPADQVASGYFRQRRFIGSGDRGEIGRTVYGVLRQRAQLEWWIARAGERSANAASTRALVIAHLVIVAGSKVENVAAMFDGDRYRPAALSTAERRLAEALAGRSIEHSEQPDWVRWNLPEWLAPPLAARFGAETANEVRALMQEAPTDLRVNVLKGERDAVARSLHRQGLRVRSTPLSPIGLRLLGRKPLGAIGEYQDGSIEIQDEGSQIAALMVAAAPGMRVVDFCAGAGGKALAIAAAMRNKGHIVACDVSEKRLAGATRRLRRAEAFNVERVGLSSERDPWVKRHAGSFDRVLIDAPCSGTGTWRRNPDAKWTTMPGDVDRLVELQARILDSACRLVKPGGRLIYVTCSLLPREDEEQVERFVRAHADFAPVPASQVWAEAIGGPMPGNDPYLTLTPARHGTDGFFIAVLARAKAM